MVRFQLEHYFAKKEVMLKHLELFEDETQDKMFDDLIDEYLETVTEHLNDFIQNEDMFNLIIEEIENAA